MNREDKMLALIVIGLVLIAVGSAILYAERIESIENGSFVLVSDSECDK